MQDEEYMYSHAAILLDSPDWLLMKIRENYSYAHREAKF